MNMFPYEWNLKDGYPSKNIKKNNMNVFGTFINGGGSTMGYKLAGFNHLGGVEIDPKVADIYKANHNPKYLYTEDIREFNKRNDLPKELYELDILDGSPPCSTFSMAGQRESGWGKEKVFREGQKRQRLDDLVFVYVETINKLRPKIAILENVKGMIAGNAKAYTKEVVRRLKAYGYDVQVFLLNAATMGVPQKRERVFFVCSRKELGYKKLKLEFNERAILIKEFYATVKRRESQNYTKSRFGDVMVDLKSTCNTIVTINRYWVDENNLLDNNTIKKIGTYPLDYNFKTIQPKYLIGMSVPPVMMAQISHQIYLQWLKGN